MSPTALALRKRFDEVCHSELQRLGRKTAGFSATEKTELVAVSLAIVRAISEQVEAGLQGEHDEDLEAIVRRLFRLSPGESPRGRCVCDGSMESED